MTQVLTPTSVAAVIAAVNEAEQNIGLLEAANFQNASTSSAKMGGLTHTGSTLNKVVMGIGIAVSVLSTAVGTIGPMIGWGMSGVNYLKGKDAPAAVMITLQVLLFVSVFGEVVSKVAQAIPKGMYDMINAEISSMNEIVQGFQGAGNGAQSTLKDENQAIGALIKSENKADTVD